jgi:hypothetical protein
LILGKSKRERINLLPIQERRMIPRVAVILIICGLFCACSKPRPAAIEELATYNTDGWAHDVAVQPERVFVSDRQGGFLVFERGRGWTDPRIVVPVKDVIALEPGNGNPLLASRFEGLVRVSANGDVSGRYSNGDIANAVARRGDLAFVAYGLHGLVVARVQSDRIVLQSELRTPGWSHDVRLRGDLAFLADWNYGFRVVDIGDPAKPVETGVLSTRATTIAIDPADPLIAVAEGHAGISVVSIEASRKPVLIGRNSLGLDPGGHPHPESGGWAHDIAWAGRYLFVANWKKGLAVLDAADPRKPRLILEWPSAGTALGVAAEIQPDGSILVFLADGEAGLRILRYRP